jgi:alkylation response protein AidB-like acyl-CoA dehydrogenase
MYKTAWEYDQAIKAGSKLVSSLGFNLCNAVVHELGILVAGHAAEVFGGRAALKEMPIEGYIRGVYDHHHFLGTSTFNQIKSISMI